MGRVSVENGRAAPARRLGVVVGVARTIFTVELEVEMELARRGDASSGGLPTSTTTLLLAGRRGERGLGDFSDNDDDDKKEEEEEEKEEELGCSVWWLRLAKCSGFGSSVGGLRQGRLNLPEVEEPRPLLCPCKEEALTNPRLALRLRTRCDMAWLGDALPSNTVGF